MIKNSVSLSEVKENIKGMREKEVSVTINLGRNKLMTFIGKIEGVYPALFTIAPTDKSFKVKTTYSYSEFMCGKVKIEEINNAQIN